MSETYIGNDGIVYHSHKSSEYITDKKYSKKEILMLLRSLFIKKRKINDELSELNGKIDDFRNTLKEMG